MQAKAFVSGCAGRRLTREEKAFFAGERPFGLILFQRNCAEPAEIRALTAEFRDAVGRADAPVFIDQEGGRVQRLKPPHWESHAPAGAIGRLHQSDAAGAVRAAWLHGRLIAADLADLGIDVDCMPVLDVIAPGSSAAIGDRSFGSDPGRVATLGRAVADGLIAGGVLPVVKHMPGHGRATADSHHALPVVATGLETLLASDFAPFAALGDLPMAMTAHVVFSAIDPARPATTSPVVIRDIIRGRISFSGLLLSDDISMHALSGDFGERAAAIYAAGCDLVLHCNGRTEEMRAVADAAPALVGFSGERAARALEMRREPTQFDGEEGRRQYRALLARVDWPVVS